MYSKEKVVNALIKIFKGNIEFIFIGDIWCKFKYSEAIFKVRYEFAFVEQCIDKYTLRSTEFTNLLEKKLKEEL